MDTSRFSTGLLRLAAVAWAACGCVLPFVPAVNAPGYLQAFVVNVAAAIMLPPLVLAVASWNAARAGPLVFAPVVGACLGAWPVTSSFGVAWLQDVLCAPVPALVHALLGPVSSGAVLAAFAALAVEVAERTGRRMALVLLLVAAFVVPSLVTLYMHPQAFSVDHVYGHFRGPIYDEGQPPMGRVFALRLESAALVAACLSLAGLLRARRRGELLGPPLVVTMAALLMLVGVQALVADEVRPGRGAVLRELSEVTRTTHADIHAAPGRTDVAMMKRIALEVDRHITELREQLGLPADGPRIRVVLYPSADDKLRLIGAHGTLLARPWQHEIHVQGTELPIPALRHELAHVVLGELLDNTFKVPAVLGLIPRILVVEGMATAFEDPHGDLTLMQRAAVMRKMGKLPEVSRLLGPAGFWLESGARAYTASGAFLRFIAGQQGPRALADIYVHGLEHGGRDITALEKAWHAHLDALDVPESHSGSARRVFRRGSLVERRCTDDVPALWQEANTAASRGDLEEAETAARAIMELDSSNDGPLLWLLDAIAFRAERGPAQRVADEVLSTEPDPDTRSRVFASLAEGAARAGDVEEALALLESAMADAQSDTRRRTLHVERVALQALQEGTHTDACSGAGLAILRFLLGDGPERARARSDLLALERARVLVPAGESACSARGRELRAVMAYLQARQLVVADPARAVELLVDADHMGFTSVPLQRENLRLLGEALENMGHFARAAGVYGRMKDLVTTDAQREELDAWTARARFGEAAR